MASNTFQVQVQVLLQSEDVFPLAPASFFWCGYACNVPVAELGAAMEALLASLLATQEPSSWKVQGEAGNVVVVLQFKQADDPSSLTSK